MVDAYEEWFKGYREDPREYLSRTFDDVKGYDDIVMLRDIEFNSHCEHHIVPMATPNLIIVRAPQAPEKNGPYHIQLVKNFAVIAYNYATDSQDMLTGMYRKQP